VKTQANLDGNAIVYCQGAYNTPNGKTAHGLVRFSRRYRLLSVVDSRYNGRDAGEVIDGVKNGIPLVSSLEKALEQARSDNVDATHLVIGLAPDGGRLPEDARDEVVLALSKGLNIDCGLHDFLSDDPLLSGLAAKKGLTIRDIRRSPDSKSLHFFSGKIEEVTAFKIAVLGTDSAVGKRTTAWKIVQGFNQTGVKAEMIGTGQTAWMQGARYCLILDSLINDFVSGEIEHTVWTAWKETNAEVIVVEGQGSLMNPAYPGGFEIIAAGRPDAVVLQHAPARKEYDNFPGYRIQPLIKQIEAVELLCGRPVVAVTVNHENLPLDEVPLICDAIKMAVGVPTFDVLLEGPDRLVESLASCKEKGVHP
jgi:uncharacterized NAD-dependent epimerase/dehydratase family protein